MWILWDLISILILILLVWIGARKGFLHSFVMAVCYLGSLLFADFLAPKCSLWIYDNFISNWLTNTITNQVSIVVESGVSTGGELLADLPMWTAGILRTALPELSEKTIGFQQNISTELGTQLTGLLSGGIIKVLSWILFLLFFIVIAFVIRLIARMFLEVNKVPVLGSVNMFFGGVVGAVQGLVLLVVGAVVMHMVTAFFSPSSVFLQPATIEGSYIFGTLYRWIS